MRHITLGLVLGLLIVGCANFSTHLFRVEQTLTSTVYGAYVGYTQGLANGTIHISADESNAIRAARLQFAAAVKTTEAWREAYETNAAMKPQAQAALDALISQSSNVVYLINLVRAK